eukprot:c20266_g1_i1 orf=344-3205(+)
MAELQQQMHRKGISGSTTREGGSPPLPSWKLYENPFYDGLAAAVVAAASAAAAVAMAGERRHDTENEGDEEDDWVQEQGFNAHSHAAMAGRSFATSSAASVCRFPIAMAAEHQGDTEKRAERVWNQGLKARANTAMTGRSSASLIRRAPLAMGGRAPAATGHEEAPAAMVSRSMDMQVDFDKEAVVRRSMPSRASEAMVRRASVGVTETHCEQGALSSGGRAPGGEETSLLVIAPSYPIVLPATRARPPSPCSPRSHLQPRPPSSTSDSPCSSKPIKASKVSIRNPQLNKSPQRSSPTSPPLKSVTLMRSRAGGDAARLRNPALKSASSSQCSPLGRDAVEQLVPPTDNHHVADGGIITSPRDYLKALNRSRELEGQRMESSPYVSTLSEELKRALTRVQELERSQISARKEVDGLLKRFADERTLLKAREQEKIQAAVFSIEEELDKERKVRRKLELENRKLSRSLAEASKGVVKAEKELDKERKARQLMEDVCDELAREIGEDKAEVEELKREHAKAREEMEEERRTLQMTEAWREERVQMKLSEAKLELEERCMALDKLKMKLEMYLNSRQAQGGQAFYEHKGEDLRSAAEKLKKETSWSMLLLENSSSHHAPQSHDDALSSDDIHSLRLSRDNVRSQSEWGPYADERARDRAKWVIDSTEYARDYSSQIIGSDNGTEDESSMERSKLKAYSDLHNSSWISQQPISRWGGNEEPTTGLASRLNGVTNYGDSDSGEDRDLDEENGDEADGNSPWGHLGENGYGNQDEESKWSADGGDDIKDLKHDVNAPGSASEEERGSDVSFSPVSSIRMYMQGMEDPRLGAAGLNQNQVFRGAGRHEREHAVYLGARHNAEDESGISSLAGSSLVYKHNGTSPDFMAQKGNWPAVPVYHSPSQGRKALVESSAPQGRRDLAEWAKPFRSNNLQTNLLLDDRMNELHLQSMHSKGPRLNR